MKNFSLLFFLLFFYCACQNNPTIAEDYSHIPEAFNIKVAIPAGQIADNQFLPYIGNFTYLDQAELVGVLTLSTSQPIGTELAVRPLGTLVLKENHQEKLIIIASPLDTALQLSKTTNFQEFIAANAGEKQIIQDWFLYQKGLGKVELIGWKDEKYALEKVKKALSNN